MPCRWCFTQRGPGRRRTTAPTERRPRGGVASASAVHEERNADRLSEGEYTHARRNSLRECRPSAERYGDRETALSTPAGPWRHAYAGADCGEPLAGNSGQASGALRSATGETTPTSFHAWWPNTPQDKDVAPSPM